MSLIPVANPGAHFQAHRADVTTAAIRVLESGRYIMGKEVAAFESEFAAFVGTAECISVGTGTDALILILRAMGIGPGDTVVTVSHTAVATVSAIDLVGAQALLVDVDPVSFTMAPESLERSLTAWSGSPIRAIIPVHLYGHPAAMDQILVIAERRGIPVIEDCAQAHGALYHGRSVGTMGLAAAFSFYPTKNLSAMGDGGALVTSDLALAERCRSLKQYGWRDRYISETNGMNTRLDELQAAMLRVTLPTLPSENRRRRAIAQRFGSSGRNERIDHPAVASGIEHVFHQYVVQTNARELLRSHLKANGVDSAILYPVPVHLQRGYTSRVSVGTGGLANTEELCGRILSLPIYPELTDWECDIVCDALRSFEG